jgi:opacity protein-like surface antigen
MKSSIKSIFIALLMLVFLVPSNVFARGRFYLDFKPGIYSPQSNDLDGFDTGFNGEIAFGYQFNRYFAAEFGVGYFNTQEERTFVGETYLAEELDIDVYPVTITFKVILPYKKWEFFGLAGGGLYIISGTYDVDDWHDYYDDDDYDDDAVLGGYLGAGIHYNITRRIFVGVEGKYLWTDKAKLDFEDFGVPLRAKFNMDGIIATAVIGFKF